MTKAYLVDFRKPKTVKDLAAYIGVDLDSFKEIISAEDQTKFYQSHSLQKRSVRRLHKVREVWEASSTFADAQKSLARRFEIFAREMDKNFPHKAAYGYVRNRGTRDNASIHSGAKLLLRADLKNFFPSIDSDRLIKRFSALGLHSITADALAKFVTINGKLPLGLHTSPMLANLICVDLDEKFEKLAASNNCKYARYADDISISGNDTLPTKEQLAEIIVSEGFELAPDKFRITKNGQAHYVTGLSISDKDSPHAPRKMKRRLRQELFYTKKYGFFDHLSHLGLRVFFQREINRLDGTVKYIRYHEKNIGEKLLTQWNEILEDEDIKPSYEPRNYEVRRTVVCYIDESEIKFHNRKYLALGLVFTEDAVALDASTRSILRDHEIADAFYAGDKEALIKKGLHFVDSHPDLRTAYIKKLADLSFRAFVIFAELKSDDDYEKTYLSLLEKILPNRLVWYDGVKLFIVIEENSKLKLKSLKNLVSKIYNSLEKANNRRPMFDPPIEFGKKLDTPSFSVPDYILAVFARYAQLNEHPKEQVRVYQFERLRDKYRLIVDGDTGKEFSRRHSFIPWNHQNS